MIAILKGKGAIWTIFRTLAIQSACDPEALRLRIQRLDTEQIKEKRNQLAHGGPVPRETAHALREIVIGDRSTPGILGWLAEQLAPPKERT
ncbi:hypothetical protein [Reticulibacter mediterranei]|nr:hypothetical protein [Reticulibacter mediterranei]